MACNSTKMSFSEYAKTTKFKEGQIKNFFLYFKKFSKDIPNQLSYPEFKQSLGILGSKSNDFICKRLFTILADKHSKYLSFGSYLSFMNLVNYGTMEQKIGHSFKFFDLENKGLITKENFRVTILSLCEYFSSVSSTQMKIREADIDVVFEDLLEKTETKKLDLQSFIHVSNNHPQILDFFDIFNNRILDNLTLIIHKETLKKIENVVLQLKNILDKTEKRNLKTNYDITLTLKSFMDKSIKNNQTLKRALINGEENVKHNFTTNKSKDNKNSSGTNKKYVETSSYKSTEKNNKMFMVSDKVSNFPKNKSFEDNNDVDLHSSFSEVDEDAEEEKKEKIDEVKELNKKTISFQIPSPQNKNIFMNFDYKTKSQKGMSKMTLMTVTEDDKNDTEDFEFLQPIDINDIQDKNLLNQILEYGIEVGKCLIITNKDFFIKTLTEIRDTLKSIVEEIDPSKKIVKRRQAFSLSLANENSPIDKDDFLNSPYLIPEEKGLIHFGNESVELVLNMMIGIRNSVNSLGTNKKLYPLVKNSDAFKEINNFRYCHKKTNEKEIQCRFYDYAPKVFHNLRKLYGISNEDYLKSLGPENFLGNLILIKNRSLRELCSAGKSGSFFYFSYDSKFVLKTISAHEFNKFEDILEDYYNHMVNNPNSLLQRFFGMHTMYFNDLKMHFVIMNNVLITNIQVHYKYDLKGSSYQRLSRKHKEINYDDYDFNVPMKDNDFTDRREKIDLLRGEKTMLKAELKKDALFLGSKNINDYSLLIGIHNPEYQKGNSNLKQNLMEQLGQQETKHNSFILGGSNNLQGIDLEEGIRKPFYERHKGGMLSSNGKQVYFFGVIDIFTSYGTKKKMEHFFKTITQGSGISCKPPDEYAQRFINFVEEILPDSDM